MVGTDFPSARVFDANTSGLVTVVELPPRSRTSLAALSLTSVAMTLLSTNDDAKKRAALTKGGVVDAATAHRCIAAVGLSDGTVLLHDVTKGELLGHIAISDTQHALISLAMCGPYLLALAANNTLFVLHMLQAGLGPLLRVKTQPDATALAVSPVDAREDAVAAFRVLVAGPTHAVYRVQMHSSAKAAGRGGHTAEKIVAFASQGTAVDYAWINDAAGDGGAAAVTASAQEGTIRVWDLRPFAPEASLEDRAALTARCRRTLFGGQRLVNICVLEGVARSGAPRSSVVVLATTFTGAVLLWDLGERLLPRIVEPTPLQPSVVLCTAQPSGRLLYGLLLPVLRTPQTVESPTVATSPLAAVSVMLLRGRFAVPQFETVSVGALMVAQQEAHVLVAAAEKRRRLVASLGFGIHPTLTVLVVPLHHSETTEVETVKDAGSTAFRMMDAAWATHQHRVAQKALATPTESFKVAHAHRATTLTELPVKQLTLEQRLRRVAAEATQAARLKQSLEQQRLPGEETEEEDPAPHAYPSLGLSTVPLYQALHANDGAAVMELLSIAARSADGMRSTVLSLQLPYALQLLGLLSERLGIVSRKTATGVADQTATVASGGLSAVSCRTPLLEWVDALIHYRGTEMYAVQLRANRGSDMMDPQDGKSGNIVKAQKAEHAATPPLVSPPKDFIAPILHQYRGMCTQYDKLAALHGRLSVFGGIRPSEKGAFINRSRKMIGSNLELGFIATAAQAGKLATPSTVLCDDILFPAMFRELRDRDGSRAIRVRSRMALEKQRRAAATTDRALLRKAKHMAMERNKNNAGGGGGLLEGSDDAEMKHHVGGGCDIDLEAMEAMGLDDEGDADGEDDLLSTSDDEDGDHEDDHNLSEDLADDDADGARPSSQKKRHETTMLAESASEEDADDDADAQLDSDEAEFSEGSDDELHSDVLDASSEEEEESSEEDEEGSEDDSGAAAENVDTSEEDNSSNDGMGDDLQDLLGQQDANDQVERRQSKRVRTD